MVVVALRVFHQIILVIILSGIEFPGGLDRRHNLRLPGLGSIHFVDDTLRFRTVLVVLDENGGAVLGPDVVALFVKGGRIESPNEFVDPDEYEDWMRRGMPQVGDVVLTTEAPLGEVAQV